jgi:hypothetical protein
MQDQARDLTADCGRESSSRPLCYIRLATSSSITSVAPPPMVRMRASRAMRSIGAR